MNYSAKTKLFTAVLAITLPFVTSAAWPSPTNLSDGSTATTKPADPLDKYRVMETLSATDLADLLRLVGFEGQSLKVAWAIAMKESHGHALSHNTDERTLDNSYGLFQINMYGSLGANRREQFNLTSNDELFDPVVNAKIAYYMSNKGNNFSAWKYPPGSHNPVVEDFISQFPK